MWIDVTPKEFYDTFLPELGSIRAMADALSISTDRMFYLLDKGTWGSTAVQAAAASFFSRKRPVAEYEANGPEIQRRKVEAGLQNKDFGTIAPHLSSIIYGHKPFTENSADIVSEKLGCTRLDISRQVATWVSGKRYAGLLY